MPETRLFDYALDMLAVGGFDGMLRRVNPAWSATLGWTDEELLARPYAELFHYESASRGSLHPPADEAFFRERWGCPGEIIDPYYNPNLDLRRPFRVRLDDEA